MFPIFYYLKSVAVSILTYISFCKCPSMFVGQISKSRIAKGCVGGSGVECQTLGLGSGGMSQSQGIDPPLRLRI